MSAAARSVPQTSPGGRKPPAAATRAQAGTHSHRRAGFVARRPSAYGQDGPEDQYVRIPHLFWGLLGACREDPKTGKQDCPVISGVVQVALLGYIAARTVGHEDKPEFVWVAISELVRELRFDQRTIERVLADSIARGLLAVKKHGQRRGYRAAMENWAEAPPYVAADAPEPDPDDEDDEDEHDEEPMAAVTPLEATSPIAVLPGSRSRSIPIRATGTSQGAVDLTLEYRSTASQPFAISASCGTKGRICITVHDPHKASGFSALDEKPPVANLRRANRRTEGEQTDSSLANSEAWTDYYSRVNSLLREYWNLGPDGDLTKRVISAANGAPLSEFDAILDVHRAELAADRAKSRRKLVPGILVFWAQKASGSWAASLKEREAAAARARRQEVQSLADMRAALADVARNHPDMYVEEFERLGKDAGWPSPEELGVKRAS
jgi:hypothetical protein